MAHVEVDMFVAHDERLASLGISQLRQLADGIPLPQSLAQEAVGHSREQPALRVLELHGLLPALRRKGCQCLVEVHFREVVVQIECEVVWVVSHRYSSLRETNAQWRA